MAEITIVLALLGVVAAITMSQTIKNYQKRVTLTQFQIALNTLEKLTAISLIENGYPKEGLSPRENFDRYFRPYLQIRKDCGEGYQFGEDRCFAGPGGGWFSLNNSKVNDGGGYGSPGYYKVILKNGMSLAIRPKPKSGGAAGSMYIVIDVNGINKGYSKLGQDTFLFTYGDPEKLNCGNKKVQSPMLVPGKLGFYICSDFLAYGRRAALTAPNGGLCVANASNGGTAPSGANCSVLLYMDKKFTKDYPYETANSKPTSYSSTDAGGMTYSYKYNSKGEVESYEASYNGNVVDTCKYNSNEKKVEGVSIDAATGDELVYKYHSNGSTVISCENKTTNESCSTKGYNPLTSSSYRTVENTIGLGADGKPVGHKTIYKYKNIYTGKVWCEKYAYGVVACPSDI